MTDKHRTAWMAFVSGALSLLLMHIHLSRFERRASGGRKVDVVGVTRDLGTGETLDAQVLTTLRIPERYVDSRHIPTSELQTLTGLRLARDVRGQETLQWGDLAGLSERHGRLADRVPHGMRAMGVAAEGPFARLIRPGDRVDVLCTPRGSRSPRSDARTHTVLENLLVLAQGQQLDPRSEGARGRGLTLGVRVQDSARLADAHDCGRLQVTLRHPDDLLVLSADTVTAKDSAGAH